MDLAAAPEALIDAAIAAPDVAIASFCAVITAEFTCRPERAAACCSTAAAAAFAEELNMAACCCCAAAPELAKLAAVINGCRVALAAEAPEANVEATTCALDALV
jgi:hypothetical protein